MPRGFLRIILSEIKAHFYSTCLVNKNLISYKKMKHSAIVLMASAFLALEKMSCLHLNYSINKENANHLESRLATISRLKIKSTILQNKKMEHSQL